MVPLACVAVASTKQSRWSSSLDLWSKLVLRGSMERAFLFLSKASEMKQQHIISEKQTTDRAEGMRMWAVWVWPIEGWHGTSHSLTATFLPRWLVHSQKTCKMLLLTFTSGTNNCKTFQVLSNVIKKQKPNDLQQHNPNEHPTLTQKALPWAQKVLGMSGKMYSWKILTWLLFGWLLFQ